MRRLLITGAAGHLGTLARKGTGHLADVLRLSDIADLGEAAVNEELVTCDLMDREAVDSLVDGCDAIVHLGGCPNENTWEVIRDANIEGVFNLYEAARKNGCPRILFASSNHAVGCYRQYEKLDAHSLSRPDGLYGISKVFGEAIASMYHHKFGIETACVRIGSCVQEPENHRMLATWLSPADFIRLIECVFRVPVLGCPIIYGMSNNDERWWSNDAVSYLGWKPKDNAEVFRSKLDAFPGKPDPEDAQSLFHGGRNVEEGIYQEPW